MTLRLRVGEAQTHHLQQYNTLATIVSQAFGGGSKASKPEIVEPKTAAEAHAIFNSLFS